MADNVPITPGAGATISTDDVGGVQVQRVKIQTGTDGTATDVSAANPVPVGDFSIDKGDERATSTTSAALLSALVSIPAGATKVLLLPDAQITISTKNTPSSTVGYRVAANTEWHYDGDSLATLMIYGTAHIDCWFYA